MMTKKGMVEEDKKEKVSLEEEKEGKNLMGMPKFIELENGRFKCVETGHELPAHAKESYAQSKHCRLGLIDAALSRNKPPLNMFQQDPQSRSRLICNLTGDTINKTEEHIWKHITGRRFLNMLDKKEAEKEVPNGNLKEESEPVLDEKLKKDKKKKKKQKKGANKTTSEAISPSDKDQDSEEGDFWMPSVGDRWDNDDLDLELASEENANGIGATEDAIDDSGELSKRTKRMSIEIGPSSFASKKKKKKIEST